MNSSVGTELNSKCQKNFGDFKILAAGRTDRFFKNGAKVGDQERQIISIPDRGQNDTFIALSHYVVGATSDIFSSRIDSKSKTEFEICIRTLQAFTGAAASNVTVCADYIVIGI